MSHHVVTMERMAIGAALAGIEPAAEGARLRGQDFHYVVAGRLYDAVAAAPVTVFGGDLDQAVAFHINALGPDTAPLVTGQMLARYAATAQAMLPRHLTVVYQQLLINAAERDIDERLGELKNRSATSLDVRAKAVQDAYQQLGYAIAHRESLSKVDGQVLVEAVDDSLWKRTQPKGQPQHHQWYHNESIILAGIIQHPATLWSVGTVVGRDAFTSPLHRDTFLALQELAARQYHPIAPGLLHRQIQNDRDRGRGTRWVTELSPAEEIAHLEALATKETVTPRETATAAGNLSNWHTIGHLNTFNGAGAAPVQPMPYPNTGNPPAPGIRL